MSIDNNPAVLASRAQEPPTEHSSSGVTSESGAHANPINILIVDDEPRNLTVLETILEDSNYRLVRSTSVDQALQLLIVEEFALLILDIQMPEMTGFDFARMIRQRKKTARLPIIFLTAFYQEDQDVLEGYETGAVDYLFKPINPTILRSKVAIFADLHRKSRTLLAEVTERRRAEEQMRQLNETLEQSRNRLLALTAELNLTEQRERKRLAIELHDSLAQMLVLAKLKLSQGTRVAGFLPAQPVFDQVQSLLSQALEYTRTLIADLSPPVLHDLGLPRALCWLSERMKQYDLTVNVQLNEHEKVSLPEDQGLLLFQSVRELLMNVSKHAKSREAWVRLETHEGELKIEVMDKGVGFDVAAVRDSAFGLFSIRERLKILGGTFALTSQPGMGTSATLNVPLVKKGRLTTEQALSPSETSASTCPSVVSEKTATTIRILLVDDHPMVRQGLQALLESYSDLEIVGESGDGEAAIASTERLRPNIVIMDVNMPRMNGVEATARIKAQFPQVQVIGLSVNTAIETQEAMTKAGASIVLPKEIEINELYRVIQNLHNIGPSSLTS